MTSPGELPEDAAQPSLLARLGTVAVGIASKKAFDFLIDWMLYPFVVTYLGMLTGGLVMTAITTAICVGLIRAYDWSQTDWLGIEALKGLRDQEPLPAARGKRLLARVLRAGDVAAFFALSLHADAFVTTLYLRRGAGHYNGMSRRDWRVFFASVVVVNAFWTVTTFGGVALLRRLYHAIVG